MCTDRKVQIMQTVSLLIFISEFISVRDQGIQMLHCIQSVISLTVIYILMYYSLSEVYIVVAFKIILFHITHRPLKNGAAK